jgi:hypothetical protein
MKIHRYKNFIKQSEINEGIIGEFYNKVKIKYLCKKFHIENYTINKDGSIDVDGDVNLQGLDMIQFGIGKISKLPLKFGKVGGHFNCRSNKLESLEGSPTSLGGHFNCSSNRLMSLEGSPTSVGGDFYCHYNNLTSLEGSPRSVGGHFHCYENQLTSLEGISKYIYKQIDCEDNQLRDVQGIKDGWRGRFLVEGNPVYEIFKLFHRERWDEVIEFLNEYEVIRDGKLIILQRFEQVFYDMGLKVPEINEIEGYDIQF